MHWITNPELDFAAALAAAAWLALTMWIMGNRLLHDARNRRLDWAMHALRDPQLSAMPQPERMATAHRILKRLPLRSLETMLMTPMPGWIRDACSVQIEQLRDPEQLLATARSGPGRSAKWDYIAALFVLTRAHHAESHALLADALSSGDADVRNAAITLLGEIGDRRASAVLIDGLGSAGSLRTRIASQLDHFKLPIGDQLHSLTRDDDSAIRAWGAQLLWRYAGEPDIDAQLAALAADPDAEVRKAAIQSLAESASPLAAATARERLHDNTPFVRAHAVRTLARSDPDGAANDIAPMLDDPDWWVRQAAKDSLSGLGLAVMPQVLEQLDSRDRFARNGAADVLQEIGAIALLGEQTHHPDPEGAEARALLDRIMQAGERYMIGPDAPVHPSWVDSGPGAAQDTEDRT